MTRNENSSDTVEMIIASGIIIFLLMLSSQGSMNEINSIDNSDLDETKKYGLVRIDKSPDIKAHQGVTTDGESFYLLHTDFIKKTDENWNEIDINKKVLSEIGGGMNHLGDGDYHNGKLYIPVEYWDDRDNFGSQHIAIWDASDLSYVGKYDISAQGHEVAGITVDNNYIYVVSFYDGTAIWKYDLLDFTYAGYISISENIESIQGITTDGAYFYISQEDYLYKISPTGTVMKKIPASVNEGIDFYQEILYCLNDEGRKEYVYTYEKST